MICKKCVLPEYKPGIVLDERGICNLCAQAAERENRAGSGILPEAELIRICAKYRGRAQYDCLVMCSGGKDSTMALYYLKKRYRMNPLVFTFDHGFENEEALDNIRRAVDILGVDWLYHKTEEMKEIFKLAIKSKTTAPLCHLCAIWYMRLVFDTLRRYRIPLLIAGWTKGQSAQRGESGREYVSMSRATADFIKRHLRVKPGYKNFPASIREAAARARRRFKSTVISPHWFLPWDKEEIAVMLEKELCWKKPAWSYPADSTNCLMNFVNVHLSMKHFGYTHYHIEMSRQIRLGELSRGEAQELLKINFDAEQLNAILKKIGCGLDDCG